MSIYLPRPRSQAAEPALPPPAAAAASVLRGGGGGPPHPAAALSHCPDTVTAAGLPVRPRVTAAAPRRLTAFLLTASPGQQVLRTLSQQIHMVFTGSIIGSLEASGESFYPAEEKNLCLLLL